MFLVPIKCVQFDFGLIPTFNPVFPFEVLSALAGMGAITVLSFVKMRLGGLRMWVFINYP